jgi:hypothetical protein
MNPVTLEESCRQFFLTFRAAEFFSSCQADHDTASIVVHARRDVPRPLKSLPHFLDWKVRWIDNRTLPPVVGDKWFDVEIDKAPKA